MRLIETIAFDTEDSDVTNSFFALEGWSGLDLAPEDDPGRKAFRRIRGSRPEVNDLRIALGAALAAADKLAIEAEEAVCPFPEIPGRGGSVEEDWRDGLRSQVRLIRREVETVVEKLRERAGLDVAPAAQESESSPAI